MLSNQQYQSPLPTCCKKLVHALNGRRPMPTRRQGLDGEVKQLMQLQLANTDQAAALQQDVEPLVAYIPSGDEKSWSAIEAFDSAGNPVYMDVDKAPARPVLVVEADPIKAKNAGLKVMRSGSAKRPASGGQHGAAQDQHPEKDQIEG
nr:DUF3103 family protein [Aeromonas fluvialis]